MTPLQEFISKRPHLIWYVKNYGALVEESVVEHVLNYGDWDDFQEMLRIMGVERAAVVFREHAFRPRTNYRKRTRHYFKRYFDAHAAHA